MKETSWGCRIKQTELPKPAWWSWDNLCLLTSCVSNLSGLTPPSDIICSRTLRRCQVLLVLPQKCRRSLINHETSLAGARALPNSVFLFGFFLLSKPHWHCHFVLIRCLNKDMFIISYSHFSVFNHNSVIRLSYQAWKDINRLKYAETCLFKAASFPFSKGFYWFHWSWFELFRQCFKETVRLRKTW